MKLDSRHVRACLAMGTLIMSASLPAHAYYEDFTDQNIVAGTGMTVASWGTNRLDVFARLTFDNKIWHKTWTGTTWTNWENGSSSPQTLAYGPGAVARGTNILDLFATGTDSAVYWNEYTSTGWSGWSSLGTCVASSPAVSAYRPSGGTATRMDLWVTGCDHVIWHRAWFSASGWSSFDNGAGVPPAGISAGASPTANSTSDGAIRVFVRGADNALYFRLWDGTAWGAWTNLGGALASDPAVTSYVQNGHDRIDVYAKGSNGYLWHRAYEWSTGWRNWESLYRSVAGAPAVVAWNPTSESRIDLLAAQSTGYTHAAFSGMYDAAYPPSAFFSSIYKVANAGAAGGEAENYVAFFPPQLTGAFARNFLSLGTDPNSLRFGDPAVSAPLTGVKALPAVADVVSTSTDNYLMRTGQNNLLAVRQMQVSASDGSPSRFIDQFYESTMGGQSFSTFGRVDGKTVTVGGIHPWAFTKNGTQVGVDYPTIYTDPFNGDRFFTTQISGAASAEGTITSAELLFRANSSADLLTPIANHKHIHFSNMTSVTSGRLFTAIRQADSGEPGGPTTAFGPADLYLTWVDRADLVPHSNADATVHELRLQTLDASLPKCTSVACTPGQPAAQCSNSIPQMSFNRAGAGPQQAFIGTPQLSRVGSYPVGDVVRIAYPAAVTLNGHNTLVAQVVTLLIDYQTSPNAIVLSKRQFAPSDTSSGRGFVGQFMFVESDRFELGSTYSGNTALAYWREGNVDSVTGKLIEKIRGAAVRDADAWGGARDITTTGWDQATDHWWGDLLQGGFFYDSTVGTNGSLTFVPVWTQPNTAVGGNDVQLAYTRFPW